MAKEVNAAGEAVTAAALIMLLISCSVGSGPIENGHLNDKLPSERPTCPKWTNCSLLGGAPCAIVLNTHLSFSHTEFGVCPFEVCEDLRTHQSKWVPDSKLCLTWERLPA